MGLEQQGINVLAALGTLRSPPRRPSAAGRPIQKEPNVVVGALIISPAAVRDRMNQVNTQMNILDSEMKTNATRPAFLATWAEFRSNWQKFYDAHQSLATILFTGTGTLDRKSNEYQAQLPSWYEALKTENPNAKLLFPPPLPPTAPPTGPSVPWWGISFLTVVGTGVLAYFAYASYRYVREAQKTKKLLQEEVVPHVLAYRGFPGGLSAMSQTSSPDSYTRVHPGRAGAAHDPAYGGTGPAYGGTGPSYGGTGLSYGGTGPSYDETDESDDEDAEMVGVEAALEEAFE